MILKLKKFAAILLSMIFVLSGCFTSAFAEPLTVTPDAINANKVDTPIVSEAPTGVPSLKAESAILMETSSGRVLFQKDSDKKMYPASMTKLLTAMVTLEYFSPDALITVGAEINEVSLDSSKAGHLKGETLSVENLIRALMIPSGNDTANVLAAAVSKKVMNDENLSYIESEQCMAKLMNEKAKSLGATSSNFVNPHGYHDPNHYTTAHDMALIAIAALKNETICKVANEKSFAGNGAGNTLENDKMILTQEYSWKSHNLLITGGEYSYEYATGLKTGFTDEAGDCIAASAKKDNVELVVVIMNSEDPDRWIDAKNLFEYGFNTYGLKEIQKKGIVDNVSLINNNRLNGDALEVVSKEALSYYVSDPELNLIKKELVYNNDIMSTNPKDANDKAVYIKAPLTENQEIGYAKYTLNGEKIGECKVYASKAVEKKTIINTIKFYVKNLFTNLFTLKGFFKFLLVIAIIIIIIIVIIILKRRNGNRYHTRYKAKSQRRPRRRY